MINLSSVVLFSDNPTVLVEFYRKVLKKDPIPLGGDFSGFEAGRAMLFIGPHDNVQGKNTNPERMVINFETEDVLATFRRIKELGARVIVEPYHPRENPEKLLATLEDPDGNYFQLVSQT